MGEVHKADGEDSMVDTDQTQSPRVMRLEVEQEGAPLISDDSSPEKRIISDNENKPVPRNASSAKILGLSAVAAGIFVTVGVVVRQALFSNVSSGTREGHLNVRASSNGRLRLQAQLHGADVVD